jgi:hypothetical protein
MIPADSLPVCNNQPVATFSNENVELHLKENENEN